MKKVVVKALKKITADKNLNIPDEMLELICQWIAGASGLSSDRINQILNYDWPEQIQAKNKIIYRGESVGMYILYDRWKDYRANAISWTSEIRHALPFANEAAYWGVVLRHQLRTKEFALDLDKLVSVFNVPKSCKSDQAEVIMSRNITVPVSDIDFYIFKDPGRYNNFKIHAKMPLEQAQEMAAQYPELNDLVSSKISSDELDELLSSLWFKYPRKGVTEQMVYDFISSMN